MRKLFICGLSLLAFAGTAQCSYATPPILNKMTNWLNKEVQGVENEGKTTEVISTSQNPISLKKLPSTNQNDFSNASSPAPKWSLNAFPIVAINQTNYQDIDLYDYLASNNHSGIIFSLTLNKPNPIWITLHNNHLHFSPQKISIEDIDSVQIIYLTATDQRNGKSTDTQITINIISNLNLPAPEWRKNFKLVDAISQKNYFFNLADALEIGSLPENDEISFQIVHTSADWLHIGQNGFSLTAHNIPTNAANKEFEVVLRASSKMSGKSNDYVGKLYVNAKAQPFQWRQLPPATVNKKYEVDLSQYVSSNLRNDQFKFNVDVATLPHWLKIENDHILTGVPREATILNYSQRVTIFAKSTVSELVEKKVLVVPTNSDLQLAPRWRKDFIINPIAGETYRSIELSSALDNRYSFDDLTFKYLSGPIWLGYNTFCHCLASKGRVPNEVAGKTYDIQLQVSSKASGQTVQLTQTIKIYSGIPSWVHSNLPDIRIGQLGGKIKIALDSFTKDDISGDQFSYRIDLFHSPQWANLIKENQHYYLLLDPNSISVREVGSTQSIRIIASSQHTQKTSVQLLSINILPNSDLSQPTWKSLPPAVATVGFQHVVDLDEYIKPGIPHDKITVRLAQGSPSWLKVKNNHLMGIPPRSEIGGPYVVNFMVYSQASHSETPLQASISVQLAVSQGDNMELHSFYDNHQSIIIRGLQKNHEYQLIEVKGSHFDYGPFYSPNLIKTEQDWNNYPFYAADGEKIKTGNEGTVSIIFYSLPTNPAPDFELLVLR